jgi:hypothetical protein
LIRASPPLSARALSTAVLMVESPQGMIPRRKYRQALPLAGPITLYCWEEVKSEPGSATLFDTIPRLPVEVQLANNSIMANDKIIFFILSSHYLVKSRFN